MATITSYTNIILCFISLTIFMFHWSRRNKNSPITNWPIVGMLPGALHNLPRLNEYVTDLLLRSGGTFEFRGPWFCNLDFLVTCDPMNMHHISTKSFENYPKGPEFKTTFEPLFGDGILAVDSDSWKLQRRIIHSYLKDRRFEVFFEEVVREKVAKSLVPVLDRACEVNLVDVFERLVFDNICSVILGRDPKCLAVEFPEVAYEKAFNDVGEAMLHRHAVPVKVWKLMRVIGVGQEKKLAEALKVFDDFVYECVESHTEGETSFDFLTFLFKEKEKKPEKKFLRDAATSMIAAGRDTSSATLSWFFYLVAMNKCVEKKILDEIKCNLLVKENRGCIHVFNAKEVSKLVYLHAALCETLRLYPPVPINYKCSILRDTLPSGHKVNPNTKVFVSFYAMGRMEEIWGKDCREFKPERWITGSRRIMHVPSYKFTAFNAGPRTCLGKTISFVQMKIVATAIIFNYQLEVVENNLVLPSVSAILHMRHGLKVRISKRSVS